MESSGRLSASATSIASASAYESLLRTVSELQGDLQHALGAADALRRDNDALRANYDKVKNELMAMKTQYDEVRRQALSEAEGRIESERRHDALVREWRAQIESRQAEFDALQQQLQPPRDLELLKLQVTEELSASYNARTAALESELAKARSSFNALQRDYESVRAEHEAFIADQSREAEAAYEGHQAALSELHRTINNLQAQLDESNGAAHAALRSTRAQLEEATAKLRLVEDENTDLLAARQDLQLQLESMSIAMERETDAQRMQIRTLEMEKAALASKVDAAETQAAQIQGTNVQISARAAAQANELSRLQNAQAVAQKAFEDELRTLLKQIESLKSENADLQRLLDHPEAPRMDIVAMGPTTSAASTLPRDDRYRRGSMERDLTSSRREATDWRRRAEEAEAQLRQRRKRIDTLSRSSSFVDAAELRRGTVRSELQRPSRAASPSARSAALDLEERSEPVMEYDIDQALALAAKFHAEADVLRSSNADLRAQNTDLKSQLQRAQHALNDMQAKKDHAEHQLQELSIRTRVMEAEARSLRELNESGERRMQESEMREEGKRKEFVEALEQARAQLNEQVAEQKAEAAKALHELNAKKEQYKKALLAARSKSEAYKEKVLAVYKLYSECKQKLQEALQLVEVTGSSKDAEIAALNKQVKELVRERELTLVERLGGGAVDPTASVRPAAVLRPSTVTSNASSRG